MRDEISELIKIGKEVFEKIGKEIGIEYAIIFGSAVKGTLSDESDIDIAVKFKSLPKHSWTLLKMILKIKDLLEEKMKREVDIVILNRSSLGLWYEVFSTGKPIYVLSEEDFLKDKVQVIKQYLDFKYYIDKHFKKKVERIIYGE